MMKKKFIDFGSAYAQLILMVFIPIAVLAAIGAYLVEKESSKVIQSEQRTLATASLIRYEPMVQQILPSLLEGVEINDEALNDTKSNGEQLNDTELTDDTPNSELLNGENEGNRELNSADSNSTTVLNLQDTNVEVANDDSQANDSQTSDSQTSDSQTSDSQTSDIVVNTDIVDNQIVENKEAISIVELNAIKTLEDMKTRMSSTLSTMNNDQHILRVAVVDESGEIIASSGLQGAPLWEEAKDGSIPNAKNLTAGVPTFRGTAYGRLIAEIGGKKYWLIVDMDNEPRVIAKLRVWLGLGLTGLFTLLILLLSLNVYSKRWIVPIYDLRMHLQQIKPDNMYQPVNTDASGELNQLQQDLVKTLRRLYANFQELKEHAKQTEEDLRDAFDEMEMQNIFIREARDQAISSSQAKSAFLANISHELRTPLNSIDGFINLLARHGDLTAEQDLYVQTIRKSSAHLLALVNDVLDFSKIEAGKLKLDRHEFSLYAAIYDVMDMLSPLAAEKNIRMAVMYYNDVPNTIIGDALRVKQVLTNLVGNAIKFTDVGEVIVRVGLDEMTHDANRSTKFVEPADAGKKSYSGDMVHIAIQDTGHGVSDAAKAQLFTSFSQGDRSITRQFGGTGLGLVISKQLTRLMGGEIGFYDNAQEHENEQTLIADSSLNTNVVDGIQVIKKTNIKSGSTFWFSIPANIEMDAFEELEFSTHSIDADNLDDEISDVTVENINSKGVIKLPVLRPFAKQDATKKGANDDKPFEILLWIDHATSLQVFMAAIRPLNIKVTTAQSLAGALELLQEQANRWEWVIIDGGDGRAHEDRAALLKQIRLHYQGKLAIYGYQVALDATLLERYKASGLYQPLDKRQLYAMLDCRTGKVMTKISPPVWQGTTVLAVDDHLPNLLVLDALLNEFGIEVITANSGYDAIDIVSKQLTRQASAQVEISPQQQTQTGKNIDLIFMDIQMPRMSGDEAASQIRQLEADMQAKQQKVLLDSKNTDSENSNNRDVAKLHIPIIALTAQGIADEKEKLIEAGIDDYVGKPISRPQLLQILQRWLGKGGQAPISLTSLKIESTNATDSKQQNINSLHPAEDKSITNASFDDNFKGDLNLHILDWNDALTRAANKPELAKQLLTMMQESVTNEVVDLQKAWADGDRERLAHVSHRILGASRYTGVPSIRQSSQTLEDKCLLNVQHTTPAQFTMLQPYYDELIHSLQALKTLDIDATIAAQQQTTGSKTLSENDMTWKMI